MSKMKPVNPVRPVNKVSQLLLGMKDTGFQGRKLGESVEVWSRMIEDPNCTIFLGLSGAMVPAGMKECLIELVKRRYVDVIVSTGANIFHDICEHLGFSHYQGYHHVNDAELYEKGIDRIYDVFAYEKDFRNIDSRITSFAKEISPFKASSRVFIDELGGWLKTVNPDSKSILSVCADCDVPVFVPAIADSSIGIGLVMARRNGVQIDIDQIADADEISRFVETAGKTGVVYIGGGVPKNFIQQTQVMASIQNNDKGGHDYAIQYTTDAPHWGGLSGCTFDEAISWGKESASGQNVQCFCDATIALPIVTSALIGLKKVRNNIPVLK